MPNDDKTFDLKKLKDDPELWKRLSTPNGEDDALGPVFEGNENPFDKNNEAAMKRVQSLASEGKLYLREYGRATHYKKVEMDGDDLKLEGTYKQGIEGSDPAMGILMRLSRAYFKWIGFDKISGWFDKRLKARDERIKKRQEYKAKYKKLSKAEKKELKKIQKQEKQLEKARRKLAKLQEETKKAKEFVDNLLAKMGKKILGEPESPLSQPPTIEEEKTSIQPDAPVDELSNKKELAPNTKETPPESKEKTEEKEKENAPLNKDSDLKITVGGKEYTRENIHEAPEDVRNLVAALDSLAKEMDRIEQERAAKKEPTSNENQKETEDGPLIDDDDSLISDDGSLIDDTESLISDDSSLIKDDESEISTLVGEDSLIEEKENLIDPEDFPKAKETQKAEEPAFDFTDFEKNAIGVNTEFFKMEDAPQADPQQMADVPAFDFSAIEKKAGGAEVTNTQQGENAPQFDFSVFENRAIGANTEFFKMEDAPQADPQQMADVPAFDFSAIEKKAGGAEVTNTQQGENAPQFDFSVFENKAIGANTEFFKMDDAPQADPQQMANAPQFDFSAITGKAPDTQMSAPLNQPAPIEKEKVGIHGRPKEQEVPGLKERLAAEEERMKAARNWKDSLSESMFSHEDGKEMQTYYNRIKDVGEVGNEYLSGAVFAVLNKASADPEKKQQVMDAILDGESVGNQDPELIRDGMAASTNAWGKLAQQNKTELENMLSKSVKELSQQVSRETSLSPRCVMIGRLISNAMEIAQNNKLDLHLSEKERVSAQGALTMSKLAQKHHNARQYLGKEDADINSVRGRESVRDLLTGNAVESMIMKDKASGEFITNTQLLMGKGVWSEENLAQMTNIAMTKKNITQDHIKTIVANPEGSFAQKIAARVMDGIVTETVANHSAENQMSQREMTVNRNVAGPEHNAL